MPDRGNPADLRVLVFAPIGRDAELTAQLLQRASITTHICPTIADLCTEIPRGAGAILLTEEALADANIARLASALEVQPPWSDISVLLFAGDTRSQASLRTLRMLEVLRNVTLLDRPVRMAAVVSTVQAALRGRRRQYELRDVLGALQVARSQAEEANRLKDEFLATLSHELRTPLNAILGWIAMLRHSQVEPPRVPKALEIIERNANAQAELIADVLDVSRMVTGRIRLNLQVVALQDVVSHSIESIRPAAEAKDIALHVQVPADTPPVLGDAQRLEQVCWNLLSNAVKFAPRGGRIILRVVREGAQVSLSVADDGIGLSPEFLPYVFDRFRQADQSFTRAHGGLGLGLAIVKHLVEMHGGHVAAESAGVGQGATFYVHLPVAGLAGRAVPPVEGAAPSRAAAAPQFAGVRILIVDDDETTRDLLTTILMHCDADVVAAPSAAAAIAALDAQVPALIVADIGMPGEDGLSMIRRIRQRAAAAGGRVPAIALSAYARAEDRAAAIDAGFNDFLTKPALPSDVVRAVERWLPRDVSSAHHAISGGDGTEM